MVYRADENYVENCVTCLTDSPDVHVVSLPHLRPQLKVNAVHLVGRSALLLSNIFYPDGETVQPGVM